MKFSIKGFFSKFDQIRNFLRIRSYLLKKSLMENLIFCAVMLIVAFQKFIIFLTHQTGITLFLEVIQQIFCQEDVINFRFM